MTDESSGDANNNNNNNNEEKEEKDAENVVVSSKDQNNNIVISGHVTQPQSTIINIDNNQNAVSGVVVVSSETSPTNDTSDIVETDSKQTNNELNVKTPNNIVTKTVPDGMDLQCFLIDFIELSCR